MAENVLVAQNLRKSFGALQAVRDVSLNIPKGSIYGFLGPNGSGKSTTLGMLLGVLEPDGGTYSWFGQGHDPFVRRKIGTLLEQPNFYNHLTGYTNLRINATIKELPLSEVERALRLVGLWERRNAKFKAYSTGMKMRLGLANAVLGEPEVMILDEPTNGLDPQGIAEVRDLIIDLNKRGHTILLASHLLDEVEKVCTHMAVLQRGSKLYEGTVAGFMTKSDGKMRIEVRAHDQQALRTALSTFNGIEAITAAAENLVLSVTPGITAEAINRHLFEQGVVLNHLAEERTTLEQQFLDLTGR